VGFDSGQERRFLYFTPEGKQPKQEANHLYALNADFEVRGAVPPLSHTSHGVMFNY
jgi:hypothetical protein